MCKDRKFEFGYERKYIRMDNRAKLLTKIFEQGFRTPNRNHSYPPPVVTLEDFFEGNPARGSIAPNLGDSHPGLEFFYEHLKNIRNREDVQEVLVNIYDLSGLSSTNLTVGHIRRMFIS
jgi:hypothetical protein